VVQVTLVEELKVASLKVAYARYKAVSLNEFMYLAKFRKGPSLNFVFNQVAVILSLVCLLAVFFLNLKRAASDLVDDRLAHSEFFPCKSSGYCT